MISFKNIRYSVGCGIVAALALTACADWDDHYEANTSVLNTQNATLWENIESNSNLSNFASLLKKTGYDKVLGASQTYTVWAPVNGSFNFDALSAASNEKVVKEFIQNHISRSNYVLTGKVNDKDRKVFMLNEKMMLLDGNGNYAIQGIGFDKMNVSSSNGILHTLKEQIPFLANIYESLNSDDYAIDSISNYFHGYDKKELNEYRSVAGPIVNGEKTYLDSVFDENNDLYLLYNSFINREDSNYTMIIPTNEAWIKAKEAIKKLYHFVPTFTFEEGNLAVTKERENTEVKLRDTNYLQDSISNLVMMNDLFYNNNLYDNKRLNDLQTGQTLYCDSLYATTRAKIYTEDAARLFENAQRVNKSNGAIWLTDSLRVRPWTSWNPEIKLEGENAMMIAGKSAIANNEPTRVYIASGTRNPAVPGRISNQSYMEVQPSASNANPEIDYYLPDIRSTEYSIYVVFVPANINNTNREGLPYRMQFRMRYADETGKVAEDRLKNPVDDSYNFSNDPTKVDTLYLGDITFPVAYLGTGNYYPCLRILSQVQNKDKDLYDRTLRIDCIILRPKNLDNYLKEHPDYKYDDGNY